MYTPTKPDPTRPPAEVPGLVPVPRGTLTGSSGPTPVVPRRDANGRLMKGTPAMNPGGRPKGLRRLFDEVVGEEGVKRALDTLQSIAFGELSKAATYAVRVRAIELLLDRRFGKPTVTLDVQGDSAPAGSLAGLTSGELAARRAALVAVLAPAEEIADAEEVT